MHTLWVLGIALAVILFVLSALSLLCAIIGPDLIREDRPVGYLGMTRPSQEWWAKTYRDPEE